MTIAISAPIRKFAAVGLALAAGWLIYGVVLEPVARKMIDNREQIEEQRLLLGQLSGVTETAAASGLQEATDAEHRRMLLAGETEAVQLANLQTLLKDAVTANGVRVQSLRTLPPQQSGELGLASALVSFNATIAAAQRILHQLETIEPILIVESLDMTPIAGSAAARAAGTEDELRIEIRVVAAALHRTGVPAR
jgi:general secretion pathway protein M